MKQLELVHTSAYRAPLQSVKQTGQSGERGVVILDDLWIAIVVILLLLILLAVTGHLKL